MAHAFDPVHPEPVRLDEVARALDLPAGAVGPAHTGTVVTGVAVSTGGVRPGTLFVALPGRTTHGATHAEEARRAGAVAVLTDPDGADAARATGLPSLVVPGVRARVGTAARLVSGTASLPFPVFGITGTNGKTSTVHLLDAVMRRLGWRTALSSTVERRIDGLVAPSALTTPEAPELHAFLARAAEVGVHGAALEISAQGLSRHRADGVTVDVAGFTNLSHDHLDDYADMDEYLAAKATLFTPDHSRSAVVSLDSRAGQQIRDRASVPVTTIASAPGTDADWTVTVVEQRPDGTRAVVRAPDGTAIDLDVPLLGRHMVADAGLALAVLSAAGVPVGDLAAAVSTPLDVVVPGRMADASASTGPRVYVDFAHTPDAFEKSLEAIRAFTSGRIAIVLGADGDRDPSKRSAMGAVAARAADVVVVADHHPRFEAPAPIRAAILAGARAADTDAVVVEEPDPARAVRLAIGAVGDDGVVYWAGPGLTDYRDVEGVHLPYSSFDDAREALREAGHGTAPRRLDVAASPA